MQTRIDRRSPLPRHAGFTLIEIMVVVMILGLLATLVTQNAVEHADRAKLDKAALDVKQIAEAVRFFYIEQGRLPTIEELTPPRGKGKRYLEDMPKDPWKGDYVLREGAEPREFEVVSAGPNRLQGDEDDISSLATLK